MVHENIPWHFVGQPYEQNNIKNVLGLLESRNCTLPLGRNEATYTNGGEECRLLNVWIYSDSSNYKNSYTKFNHETTSFKPTIFLLFWSTLRYHEAAFCYQD